MDANNLRIDGARLWASLGEMAGIGPGVAGGNNRQALTEADGAARRRLAEWCGALGLDTAVDGVGNMMVLRPGTDPDARPVAFGSHLDTQPTGGRYDGVLGVLGGLEILRTVHDLGIRTRRPLLLVNWTDEEGTRFAPPMMGSAVHAGATSLDEALATTDDDGTTLGAALDAIGWRGAAEPGAQGFHAYYELHIEQGPVLEAEGIDIGVVTAAQGHVWLDATLTGRESHSGATPMGLRKDAGLGLARLAERVHAIALAHQPDAVGTIGRAILHPNSRNVIAGRVEFTVDLRSPDAEKLRAMRSLVETEARAIADNLGLGLEIRVASDVPPVAFDPERVARVRRAAERLGVSHRDIVSGAGHDACLIARVAPTAMVFCPCEGGLSHNEAEAITEEWARRGTEVLMHAVLAEAEIVA